MKIYLFQLINEFPVENDKEVSMSSHTLTNKEEDFKPIVETLKQQKDTAYEESYSNYLFVE